MLEGAREHKGQTGKRLRAGEVGRDARLLGSARRGGTEVFLERQARLTQAFQDLQVLGHGQKALHARRDLGANAIDLRNLFLTGQKQLVDRQEVLCQQLAHALAHVTDAQREQHAAEGLFLGVHELAYHLLGGLLPHGDGVARAHALLGVVGAVPASRLQARDVVYGEGIEVGHVVNQTGLEHLVHQLVADAVHVHAPAAHPVQQALLELCRAVERDTAVGHLALFVHHGAAAHGTARGHLPRQRVCGALVGHRPHDLGDHVARLMHHDRVAHAHVLAVHLVDIVQRGARDGGAGHRHRIELGHRGEHARAAHLHADLA